MELYIGGAFQNKIEYVTSIYSYPVYEEPSSYKGPFIWKDFHLYIKGLLENLEPEAVIIKINEIINDNPEIIFVSDELGCGLIPMKYKDRVYRETVGRLHCLIASKSSRVVRLVCSIPVIIKY